MGGVGVETARRILGGSGDGRGGMRPDMDTQMTETSLCVCQEDNRSGYRDMY